MKKILIVAIGLMTVAAYSDIAVNWYHGGYVADEGFTYDNLDPVLAQLIWSRAAPTNTAIASVGGGLVAEQGELELASAMGAWGNFASPGPGVYVNDLIVGIENAPATINEGFIFARVWNGAGTFYHETAVLAPVHIEYSALDTGTIIDANLVPDYTKNTNIEAIPEPATLGLIGIAGLGMYLARRKVRS